MNHADAAQAVDMEKERAQGPNPPGLVVLWSEFLGDRRMVGEFRYHDQIIGFLTTDPVDWPIVHEDSYSDGMCGWVEMLDRKNGNKQRVSWSVTGKFQSQSAAMDEARRLLRNKR